MNRRKIEESRLRRICLSVSLVTILGLRRCGAITIRDDTSDSLYTALSAQAAYASIGYVDVLAPGANVFGTGILIAPDWVLTTAHSVTAGGSATAVPAGEVSFGQGASATPFTPGPDPIAQVVVDPSFTGNLLQGNDLALLQLTTPITTLAPAAIYPGSLGSEIGLTATAVGYGDTGTGLTGQTEPAGTRRALQNVIESFGGVLVTGGTTQDPAVYSLLAYSSNLLFTDFVSPNSSQWPSTNIMGVPDPLPLEGAIAPGDSGGGLFVTVNNQTYLDAVTDFEGNMSTNPDGKYGDYDGYVRLSAADSLNFLNSALAVTSAWTSSGGGAWSARSDWSNFEIPEFAAASANFGPGIAAPATITLDADWTVGTLTFNNTNSYTLAAASNGTLTLNNGSSPALLSNLLGSHTISAPLMLTSALKVTSTFSGSVLTLSGPISGAAALTVAGAGTLRLASSTGADAFTSLTVNSGSTLDITSNTITVNYGSPANDPVASIVSSLAAGYNAGAWTGTGINSSTAAANRIFSVAYADGDAVAGAIPAGIKPNQLVIKYSLDGDANLDGVVNSADLLTVLQNINRTGNSWAQGNFTYNPSGLVNSADLLIVIQNFNQSLSAQNNAGPSPPSTLGLAAITPSAATLPEPATAMLLAPLLAAGLARRVCALRVLRRIPPLPPARPDGKTTPCEPQVPA
jgi:trypsin/dockerin type I repeat protein